MKGAVPNQPPVEGEATAPAPSAPAAAPPAAAPAGAAAAKPEDKMTAKKALLMGFVGFMGRRIPTTVPEIDDKMRDDVFAAVQPGDILLSANCEYPGLARMEFWTIRSDYTHAAIYEGDGKFLEATTPGGVKRSDLREYAHGRQKLAIVRPDYKTPKDRDAALDYCRSHLGKEYDNAFDGFGPNSDKDFYCSEYVYKALANMPNPIVAPTQKFFGKEAVAPDAFFKMDNAKVIVDGNSGYWRNKIGHWPLAVAALGSAAAGAAMAGMGGGIAGFSVGLLGGILVGNKIQTGYALPSIHDIKEAKKMKIK